MAAAENASNAMAAVENASNVMAALIDTTVRDSCEFFESQRKSSAEAQALVLKATSAHIANLQEQNARLMRLLEAERERADRLKEELLLEFWTGCRDRW
jgi:kinesin family member 11